jgi:hypothetical protein
MFRIYGRVLVKESNAGIPNLVVAAIDQDVPRPNPGDGPHPSGGNVPVIEAATVPAEIPPLGVLDRLGDRLGSVLTDANGNFEISFDDNSFLAGADHTGGRLSQARFATGRFRPGRSHEQSPA